MRPEIVVAGVLGVPANVLHDDVANTSLAQWDSMSHVELIVELEATYGISMSAEAALEMTTVGAIKRVLSRYGVTW